MAPFRVRYHTVEFEGIDIHVRTLRDKQQYCDSLGIASGMGISSAAWPLFGVIWESGEMLAHLMVAYPVEGKRVLEVGCGIGLASLVLNHRHADITATDRHPEAESFLRENTRLNKGPDITFFRTSWDDESISGVGLFDLIIGSDLLYEKVHAETLSSFINRHSKEQCRIIIVDPGRGHSARFARKMIEFGYDLSQTYPSQSPVQETNKSRILCFDR